MGSIRCCRHGFPEAASDGAGVLPRPPAKGNRPGNHVGSPSPEQPASDTGKAAFGHGVNGHCVGSQSVCGYPGTWDSPQGPL